MLADTAQLIVDLQLKSNLASAVPMATGAMSTLERAAGGIGTAMNHAKTQIGNLIGSFGMLAGGMGLLSVVGMFKSSITEAEDFGNEVLRLMAVSGMGAEKTSALAAALDHVGIESDKAKLVIQMLEKNVGNLTSTVKEETDFEQVFGFQLRDTTVTAKQAAAAEKVLGEAKATHAQKAAAAAIVNKYNSGTIKDANDLVLEAADYFNNNLIPASEKAAAMGKLFGKSWGDMVPLLSLGRQGIADVEEEAASMGLTITQDNIPALIAMRDNTRTWNDAIAGLKLQIGLGLMPVLSDMLHSMTGFVTTHRDDIVKFFKDATTFAKQMGAAVKDDVLPIFKTIIGAWNSLPDDLKKLLIGGFVVNKASSWLFGSGPLDWLKSLMGGAAGAVGSKGVNALVPQNVFVVNWAMMGGLGAAGAAAGEAGLGAAGAAAGEAGLGAAGAAAGEAGLGAEMAAGEVVAAPALAAALSPVLLAAVIGGLAVAADPIQKALGTNYDPGKNLPLDQMSWPWGPKNTPVLDIGPFKNILGGDTSLPAAATTERTKAAWETTNIGVTYGGGGGSVEATRYAADKREAAEAGARINKAANAAHSDAMWQLKGHLDTKKAVADGMAILKVYTSGTAKSTEWVGRNITVLKQLQQDFADRGDTKTAAALGSDIDVLRTYLGKKMDTMTAAVNTVGSNMSETGWGGPATPGTLSPQHGGKSGSGTTVIISARDVSNAQTHRTARGLVAQ